MCNVLLILLLVQDPGAVVQRTLQGAVQRACSAQGAGRGTAQGTVQWCCTRYYYCKTVLTAQGTTVKRIVRVYARMYRGSKKSAWLILQEGAGVPTV